MEAHDLSLMGSSRAPKEWRDIPEIKAAKPKQKDVEISLQRLGETNICRWYIRGGVNWIPTGNLFLVAHQTPNRY